MFFSGKSYPLPGLPPCSPCPLCEPFFKSLEQTKTSVSRRRKKKKHLRRDALSVPRHANLKSWRSQMFSEKGRLEVGPTSYPQSFLCVLCALCANPFFSFWNENRGIAPSQKEGALTPRCLRSGYRAVAKRRSAYAAMPFLYQDIPTEKLAFPIT
ncbi:MAG: hypothetical protein BWX67_02042 [Thermotogae bacterium ADurb.Bin062]|jgi:hypothetical protein|nr:MAG: hypothetical protein BWX67_02042 [Thermotogota bacterium ADurb.Bin062]